MAVVDQLLVAASQTREAINALLGVPNLNVIHVDASFDFFADQPTVY